MTSPQAHSAVRHARQTTRSPHDGRDAAASTPGQHPALSSPEELRHAFAAFPSGVTAACALIAGAPAGISASSFTSVSLNPPLVSVCIARSSETWPVLRTAGRLGLSVLARRHHTVARALAARGTDRFAGVQWTADEAGAVFIDGACLWLGCGIRQEVPAGDHLVALLEIASVREFPSAEPLVFHQSRFRQLREEETR
jgi:flavin reductase (DIM6/NTAB) family NADH-FMN oxidoreductase RutF